MLGSKVSQYIKKRYTIQPEKSVPQVVIGKQLGSEESTFEKVIDTRANENPVSKKEKKPAIPEQPELVIEQDLALNKYKDSRLGRTYGWWVNIDGKRVASLEYCCFLEELVHLYKVYVLDDTFMKIDLDPVKWLDASVTIQSRYAESYIRPGLSMAAVGKNNIVVENLSIPQDQFQKRYQEIKELHDKLIENAKRKK